MMTQNVSLKYKAVKNFNFKNIKWQTVTILKSKISITHDAVSQTYWSHFKIKFSLAEAALERGILHHQAKFCLDISHTAAEITQFFMSA